MAVGSVERKRSMAPMMLFGPQVPGVSVVEAASACNKPPVSLIRTQTGYASHLTPSMAASEAR